DRSRAGPASLRANARGGRPRREPPAGAGAPAYGAGVPAEMRRRCARLALAMLSAEIRRKPMALSPHAPSRRERLLASGVLFAWAHLPREARAEGRDPRLLVIVLRGALDGLATVAPVGDPDWIRLRGDKALTREGPNAALDLDGFFALNPAMPN